MNQALAVAPPRPANIGFTEQTARKALEDVRRRHINLFAEAEKVRKLDWVENSTSGYIRLDGWDLHREKSGRLRAIANDRIEYIPLDEARRAITAPFEAALAAPASPQELRECRVLISMLIGGYRTVNAEEPALYIATLQHYAEADGHGPTIIAAACDAIRQDLKFPPSVAELLEACKAKATILRNTIGAVERAGKARHEAERAIADAYELRAQELETEIDEAR